MNRLLAWGPTPEGKIAWQGLPRQIQAALRRQMRDGAGKEGGGRAGPRLSQQKECCPDDAKAESLFSMAKTKLCHDRKGRPPREGT